MAVLEFDDANRLHRVDPAAGRGGNPARRSTDPAAPAADPDRCRRHARLAEPGAARGARSRAVHVPVHPAAAVRRWLAHAQGRVLEDALADPHPGFRPGAVHRARRRRLHPPADSRDTLGCRLRPGGGAVADRCAGGFGHRPGPPSQAPDARVAGRGADERRLRPGRLQVRHRCCHDRYLLANGCQPELPAGGGWRAGLRGIHQLAAGAHSRLDDPSRLG